MHLIENKLLARRFIEEVVNTGTTQVLDQFLSPEFVSHDTGLYGIESVKHHIEIFHHCYPDLQVTVEEQVAEGDMVVTRFTMRGRHRGEWGGIKPTNKVVILRGINMQRIHAGRIIEQWGAANTFEALLEIGAIQIVG